MAYLLVCVFVLEQQAYGRGLLQHKLRQALVQIPVQLAGITVAQQVPRGRQHAAVVVHLRATHTAQHSTHKTIFPKPTASNNLDHAMSAGDLACRSARCCKQLRQIKRPQNAQ